MAKWKHRHAGHTRSLRPTWTVVFLKPETWNVSPLYILFCLWFFKDPIAQAGFELTMVQVSVAGHWLLEGLLMKSSTHSLTVLQDGGELEKMT